MFDKTAFILIPLFCLLFCKTLCAQEQIRVSRESYPKGYFRSPIDTTIVLAGNFAELRPNHFHAGIDIKTGNRTGMPVHAAADGYVSRIKISSFGYGKVIYVTHPNGYVTVYGHLSSFKDSIGAYVEKEHYLKKSFEIELFPSPTMFPVKKGQVIAFSGNTGNSGGPHVHFEIRDEKTERALNPLLFGLPVTDTKKPVVRKLIIYPKDENSLINGKNQAYTLDFKKPVLISGNVYFGMDAYDQETHEGGKNGVYSIEVQVNGKTFYQHEMNSIGFDETRAINSFIEYKDYMKTGKFIQRTLIEPNNRLGIYKTVMDHGVFNFNTDSVYKVEMHLKDVFQNTRTETFTIQSQKQKDESKTRSPSSLKSAALPFFDCRKLNSFSAENFSISLPANVLYSSIWFEYRLSKMPSSLYSPVYHVHSLYVPLHDYVRIALKPTYIPPEPLKRHLFIAKLNQNGRKEFIAADWSRDSLIARTREFGDYLVCLDTIPPQIKALSLKKKIEFSITDDFSGIQSYNAYLDGNWILMEYEYKQNKLFLSENLSRQHSSFITDAKKHELKLIVSDNAGNIRIFHTFVRF